MTPASMALNQFLVFGKAPPFVHKGVAVVSATSRLEYGLARRGQVAHRIVDMVSVRERNRLRYGARWVCGANSNDALPIREDQIDGDRCQPCEMNGPALMYRCLNAAGQSLYIGSTNRRYHRMQSHRCSSEWWPEVADVQYVEYPSLAAARAAERRAILAETPIYNKSRIGHREEAVTS